MSHFGEKIFAKKLPYGGFFWNTLYIQGAAKVLTQGAKVLTFQKRVFSTILDEKTPFQRF